MTIFRTQNNIIQKSNILENSKKYSKTIKINIHNYKCF